MPRYVSPLKQPATPCEEEEQEIPKVHIFSYSDGTNHEKQLVSTNASICIRSYKSRRKSSHDSGLDSPIKTLKNGQDFEGFVVKTKSSPYDYATKLWDAGKVPPPDEFYPKEGEEYEALVIDRINDHLVLGCGPHVAVATRESFRSAGIDPDSLELPHGPIKVYLHPFCSPRPTELLIAAWTATPKPMPTKYSDILSF